MSYSIEELLVIGLADPDKEKLDKAEKKSKEIEAKFKKLSELHESGEDHKTYDLSVNVRNLIVPCTHKDSLLLEKWIGAKLDEPCFCYHPDNLLRNCLYCLNELAMAISRARIIK